MTGDQSLAVVPASAMTRESVSEVGLPGITPLARERQGCLGSLAAIGRPETFSTSLIPGSQLSKDRQWLKELPARDFFKYISR